MVNGKKEMDLLFRTGEGIIYLMKPTQVVTSCIKMWFLLESINGTQSLCSLNQILLIQLLKVLADSLWHSG